MSLLIFSSYSHKDHTIRDKIDLLIRNNTNNEGTAISFIADKYDLSVGTELDRWIEKSIAESDILLTILTPRSINSWWVLYELSLARRYGCNIIAVCVTDPSTAPTSTTTHSAITPLHDDPLDSPLTPPWLTDHKLIKVTKMELDERDSADRIAKEIADAILLYDKKINSTHTAVNDARVCLYELSLKLKSETTFEHEFRAKQAKQVLQEANKEIAELQGGDYAQNLSLSKAFVIRAQPIFSEADEIYATSVDFVSTFWEREATGLAPGYLASHTGNVKRLFVFSSPRQANRHRNILQAHHNQYGQDGTIGGCVLFTTVNDYKMLTRNRLHDLATELRKGDFAILRYFTNTDQNHIYYQAQLTDDSLFCKQLTPGLDLGRKTFVNEMNRLVENTRAGQIDEETSIVRWSDDFSNQSLWTQTLEKMFHKQTTNNPNNSTRDRDVFHLVFFRPDAANAKSNDAKILRKEISDIADMLKSLKHPETNNTLVKELWFGDVSDDLREKKPKDGRYSGDILTHGMFIDNFPYCLLMRFESGSDLNTYYEHEIHSEAREFLFRSFDPNIASLYNLLSNTQSKDQCALIYKAIEALASKYVMRVDYVEHEDIKWIVEHETAIEFRAL